MGKKRLCKNTSDKFKGVKTSKIIKSLSQKGIKLNITALFTKDQIKETVNSLDKKTKAIISVFSGRIADTGINPTKIMEYSIKLAKKKKIEVLWASTRETYNIFEAEKIKCHIITVPHSILSKFNLIGMNLKKLSLLTVKSFLKDSINAGFRIKV